MVQCVWNYVASVQLSVVSGMNLTTRVPPALQDTVARSAPLYRAPISDLPEEQYEPLNVAPKTLHRLEKKLYTLLLKMA